MKYQLYETSKTSGCSFRPSETKTNPLPKRYEVEMQLSPRINPTDMLKHIGDAFPNLEEFVLRLMETAGRCVFSN